MGRIALVGNLVQPTGGTASLDLAATAVKHLFELLARAPPGPGPSSRGGCGRGHPLPSGQERAPRAIDPDSEVHVLPQIAGG